MARTPKVSPDVLARAFDDAMAAGRQAAADAVPVPMVVYDAIGLSDVPDPDGNTYHVPDGVCGFGWAWFDVDGRSAVAKWLVAHGAHKHYYGGYALWSPIRTQSMTRNAAWARGFCDVFGPATGITCYGQSRMD